MQYLWKMFFIDWNRKLLPKILRTCVPLSREMQIALDVAFQSKDSEVQKEWAKIPYKGDHPTPEDVIPYLAGQLKNSQEIVS